MKKLIKDLDETTACFLQKQEKDKVEASFEKRKIYGFLEDLIELCLKHNVVIKSEAEDIGTEIVFHNWDDFSNLEVDKEGASLYWPRIQADIVVRRSANKKEEK